MLGLSITIDILSILSYLGLAIQRILLSFHISIIILLLESNFYYSLVVDTENLFPSSY